MMAEKLFGGSSRSSSARVRRNREQEEATTPPQVGLRFLAVLILLGAGFTGLGVWKVNTVFRVRDYEMETRRLQELAQLRRDRYTALVSRVSQLNRGEVLKATAVEGLGMAAPLPEEMESMVIPLGTRERWQRAAGNEGPDLHRKEDL